MWLVSSHVHSGCEAAASAVTGLAQDPSREVVASTCADGSVKLWDMRRGCSADGVQAHQTAVLAMHFAVAPETPTCICSDPYRTDGKAIVQLRGEDQWEAHGGVEDQGGRLVVGYSDGSVRFFDTLKMKVTSHCKIAHSAITSLKMAAGGSILVAGAASGELVFYYVETQKMRLAHRFDYPVHSIDVGEAGACVTMAVGGRDARCTVSVLETVAVPEGGLATVAGASILMSTELSPGGEGTGAIAVFSDANTVYCTSDALRSAGDESPTTELQVLDVKSRSVLRTIALGGANRTPTCMALSSSKRWIGIGTVAGNVLLLSCDGGGLLDCGSLGQEVTAITFSADSRAVVSSTRGGLIATYSIP